MRILILDIFTVLTIKKSYIHWIPNFRHWRNPGILSVSM